MVWRLDSVTASGILSDNLETIIPGVCLVGSVFLSLACYSLRNFSRSRLAQICRERHKDDRFGHVLKHDEDAQLACEMWLVVLLTVGLCVLVVGQSIPEGTAARWTMVFEGAGLVAGLLLGVVIVPWALSLVAGEQVLYRTWPLLSALTVFSRPLLLVAGKINTLFHRVAGRKDPDRESVDAFAEEIQSVVHEGEREGLVETRHGRMIQRVMELHEVDVEAVMTPRTDVVFLPANASFDEARRVIIESGHSRIPVYGDSQDDVVGILYARELLANGRADGDDVDLAKLAREPLFIPETTSIETLLEIMKKERTHVAIVLDEYGGMTGLVTMEDLLEEIVGNIEDEFDEQPEEQIVRVDPTTIEVDARVHIDDLNEQFEYELPEEEDYDTIGGFVFSELGRIPVAGDKFRWRNLDFTVLEADKRRIIKLRIELDRAAVIETVEET